jgi:hypothetical protein
LNVKLTRLDYGPFRLEKRWTSEVTVVQKRLERLASDTILSWRALVRNERHAAAACASLTNRHCFMSWRRYAVKVARFTARLAEWRARRDSMFLRSVLLAMARGRRMSSRGRAVSLRMREVLILSLHL